MSKATPEEIEAALARLRGEELHPVEELCHLLGPGVHSGHLIRFAQRGTSGVRLDAVKEGDVWLTSEDAIRRFQAALAAIKKGESG